MHFLKGKHYQADSWCNTNGSTLWAVCSIRMQKCRNTVVLQLLCSHMRSLLCISLQQTWGYVWVPSFSRPCFNFSSSPSVPSRNDILDSRHFQLEQKWYVFIAFSVIQLHCQTPPPPPEHQETSHGTPWVYPKSVDNFLLMAASNGIPSTSHTFTTRNSIVPHHVAILENAGDGLRAMGLDKAFFTEEWDGAAQLKALTKALPINRNTWVWALVVAECYRKCTKKMNVQNVQKHPKPLKSQNTKGGKKRSHVQ